MFNMEIDRDKKAFIITVAGSFTSKESMDFLNDFHTLTKEFDLKEFTLVVDGKDLRVSASNVSDKLRDVIELYSKSPFKKRIIVKQKSAMAFNQSNRLAIDIFNSDTFLFVNTIEEAFSKL